MKAIFVVDTTKCRGCPFCHESAYYSWCDAPRKERFWEMPLTSKDIEEERTVECPLKPMPMKRETMVHWKSIGGGNIPTREISDYDKGWNDCIDFLEGDMQDD